MGHGSFIDSGTTLVYGHAKIFNELIGGMKEMCKTEAYKCPNMLMIQSQMCFQYDNVS